MKYKLIAAAILAAGMSNVANAAIVQTNTDLNNTGGSELVLSLFDGTQSFTVDLGLAMGSSIPASVVLADLSTSAASFFTGGVLNSNVQWAVTAADSILAVNPLTSTDLTLFGQRMLTTVNGPAPATTGIAAYTNADIQQSAGALTSYISNLNSTAGHAGAANGSQLSASPADAFSWSNGMQANWAQLGRFDATANGAGTMAFMQLAQAIVPGNRGGGTANPGDVASQSVLGQFTLAANGQLSFAPVPVPAAVWLFGSALMGLVGVARRRNATV
jgi:hypothetical protein